ncbi:MAG: class I SAM-dependent methyltransferase [Coriobacteriia bacterium]
MVESRLSARFPKKAHTVRRNPLRKLLATLRWRLRNRFYLTYGFRGTAPINPGYGYGLGTVIDRYYEHVFLEDTRPLIRGHVLEVGDRKSTDRFGSSVSGVDVLNPVPGPGIDIVADLTSCPQVPDDTYDCVLLTEVIHVILDMEAAISEVYRILKPGGSVIATIAGIAQVNRGAMEEYGDRWRVTSLSAGELFATRFPVRNITVRTYGNAHTACCYMQGIPAERVKASRLDLWESDYQLIVAVVATKPS